MTTYLVTIQDKDLYGEPDVALAVVEATDEAAARLFAYPAIEELADRGRGRCVPHARAIEFRKIYRLGAVIRLPPPDRDDATERPKTGSDLTDDDVRELHNSFVEGTVGDAVRRQWCHVALGERCISQSVATGTAETVFRYPTRDERLHARAQLAEVWNLLHGVVTEEKITP